MKAEYYFLLVLAFYGWKFWQDYFTSGEKMTDDQLINRFVFLERKHMRARAFLERKEK